MGLLMLPLTWRRMYSILPIRAQMVFLTVCSAITLVCRGTVHSTVSDCICCARQSATIFNSDLARIQAMFVLRYHTCALEPTCLHCISIFVWFGCLPARPEASRNSGLFGIRRSSQSDSQYCLTLSSRT